MGNLRTIGLCHQSYGSLASKTLTLWVLRRARRAAGAAPRRFFVADSAVAIWSLLLCAEGTEGST
jgi:hypothetical protein